MVWGWRSQAESGRMEEVVACNDGEQRSAAKGAEAAGAGGVCRSDPLSRTLSKTVMLFTVLQHRHLADELLLQLVNETINLSPLL